MIIVFGDVPESFKKLKEWSYAKRRIMTIKPSRRRTAGERHVTVYSKQKDTLVCVFFWSGLRGSNPPPPPWQGGALPNELNPRGSVLSEVATRMGLEPTTSSVTG